MTKHSDKDDLTKLAHAGRDPARFSGAVNVPVHRASTILFDSAADMARAGAQPYGSPYYGRRGTPTQFGLQEAVADLEGGFRTILTPAGLSAVTVAILSFVEQGDHVLIPDSVYDPTRKFCDQFLTRMGVATTYYDPTIGGAISELISEKTKLVFTESPGSLTFEVQDIPAIARAAHAKGALVVMDNTWATPFFFKPFDHGVDVAVVAGTKYIVGHADAMLGLVTVAREELWDPVFKTHALLGLATSPDDAYLGARGLRTLGTRLKQHHASGLEVARWLEARPEVARVIHPGLESHPQHDLWARDFTGASGLFAFELKQAGPRALSAMLDDMQLFGMGYSWGGFESLLIPTDPAPSRTAVPYEGGPMMRIHVGLEAPDDLIQDLEAGFARLTAALDQS